jgi:hypothetical protein
MNMQTKRQFVGDTDRYAFDFRLCTYANGWAQVDSREDAPYYGHWANPRRRMIVGYAEGDVDTTTCETDEEFAAELRKLCNWLKEYSGLGAVDPGFSEEMKADFERLGCGDLLH